MLSTITVIKMVNWKEDCLVKAKLLQFLKANISGRVGIVHTGWKACFYTSFGNVRGFCTRSLFNYLFSSCSRRTHDAIIMEHINNQ